MQAVEDLDINAVVSRQLKKNPDNLLAAIEKILESPETFSQIKPELAQIESLWAEESGANEQRKKLSRQIGLTKKNNQDAQPLIDQVASLSAQIKALQSQRKNLQTGLAARVMQSTQQPTNSAPLHFTFTDKQTCAPETPKVEITKDFERWQAFVDSCEHSTIYHNARWLPLIERNFAQKTYAIVCENSDGELLGVMPLVHMQSKIFGSFTVSAPYFNYGGPLAATAEAAELLMQYAANTTRKLGCSHMEVRETHPRDHWPCSQRKVSMILGLPDSDTTLNKQLGSKLRAQVNRAASHALAVRTGGTELLEHFYRVYSHNMRDLGTPAYAKTFFADILRSFPDDSFITTVEKNNKPIAAGFLLGHRDKLEIPWASSLRKHNSTGANMLLYRSILSEAITRGYHYFDFGRSTKDANTYRFKKQWGAEEYPLYWHYWTANNEIPQINPDNPKYKAVIATWKKMPVAATRLIGPLLARNLP